jgi:asparagine synthase (glutamine-hydrolysing)
MCGIAGILELGGRAVAPELLQKMGAALAHRGPDAAGSYADGAVGLVHTRLSIIDLESGAQPLLSSDGACALVYNGEVYNFRALRAELERLGCAFRTNSDTEVILLGYQVLGAAVVERLEGMFAFALWDGLRQRLLLARDRLGIKPLYLYQDGQRIAFASEVKALLRLPFVDRSWDEQALHDYFAFRYIPAGKSAYRAVRELAPGTLASVERGVLTERRYWTLRPAPLAAADAVAALPEVLARAVEAQTVADVEIGAFLSGGIDSGLVVANLARNGRTVSTCTVYDPDVPFYDERAQARRIAERFGTQHREIPARTDIATVWQKVPAIFDEPFADSMAVPHLVVSHAMRTQAKVALSGLGGDELFGGYPRYLGFALGRRVPVLPQLLRRSLAALVAPIPDRSSGLAVDWLKRFARLIGSRESELYTGLVTSAGQLTRPILTPQFRARVDAAAPLAQIEVQFAAARELGLDAVNTALYTDLSTFLVGDLLRCADRTSMAAGLEVRVPFLHTELVELALAIPGSLKVRRGRLKWLLREVARDILSHEIAAAPKRGFSVPMAEWLRGPLAPFVEEAVEKHAPATGILDRAALRTLWNTHRARRESHEATLWSVLVFSLWATGAA